MTTNIVNVRRSGTRGAGSDVLQPIADAAAASASTATTQAGIATTQAGIATAAASSLVISSDNTTTDLTIERLMDDDGGFIAGTAIDGRRFASSFAKRPRLWSRQAGGFEHIFVSDHLGDAQLTHGDHNNTAPEWLAGGLIRFTSDRTGPTRPYVMKADGTEQATIGNPNMLHATTVGQSMGMGANTSSDGSTGEALTTTNQTPTAFMAEITGGVTPYGPRPVVDSGTDMNSNHMMDGTEITGLVPLKEAVNGIYGETLFSGFAAQYCRDNAANIVCETHARGAAPWLEPYNSAGVFSAPGSPHFGNGSLIAQALKTHVEAEGFNYVPGPIILRNGEADAAGEITGPGAPPTPRGTFTGYIIDCADAYNQHGRASSNHHRQRRLYTQQISSFVLAQPGAFEIALAQADASLQDGRVFVPCSSYQFEHGDTIHLTAASQRWSGEYIGKWARRIEFEGLPHKPFIFHKVELIGSHLFIHFHKQIGLLRIATDQGVSAIAQSGLTYNDDEDNAFALSDVQVYDAEEYVVRATPSSTSFGTDPTIYAALAPTSGTLTGPVNGARTNICDSDAEIGELSGNALVNFALHWKLEITT